MELPVGVGKWCKATRRTARRGTRARSASARFVGAFMVGIQYSKGVTKLAQFNLLSSYGDPNYSNQKSARNTQAGKSH